jgi:hypothetical protein
MRKYVIERIIPAIGSAEPAEMRAAAERSNNALKELGPDIQWVHSYVTEDKTFCIYLTTDERLIHKHAEMTGFPADKITEIKQIIDPTTANEEQGGEG